ncbi:4'-phosphopantetheinyl transferase [Psychrobacter luti]|uniref:4'-phosphopantetheinyl transferase n=1 Tax=Psychrobacter luti TaxID=198481 RepID=A0A839T9D4_9GAMM|nr:4'-phosphopantetheinyl transferase superfamily protein [Psychrobacter luti]MBB3106031.1 4'-phosphopantetheinyl transferase [Psychrobacter luti]
MIPTLNLHDIQYSQLDSKTWCATAQVTASCPLIFSDLFSNSTLLLNANLSNINTDKFCHITWHYYIPNASLSARKIAYEQRQQQRAGVRLLLQSLLNKLNINDSLDDLSFPYRLVNSQYYVCFSHTGRSSPNTSTQPSGGKPFNGLDNKVAVVISFHRPVGIDIETNNLEWRVAKRFYHMNEIAILQTLTFMQRDTVAKLLWQIKESFIKIHQYKLAQGLGMDYSYLITGLVNGIEEQAQLSLAFNDDKTGYYLVLLPKRQTVIVY